MLKVNQLKAGAILSYASMFIGYIVSIIYTPIMLRLLGQSEYGLYNLVSSVVAYLGVLNFGFGSAYMRYYSRYKVKDDQNKIATLNGMFLIIFSVIGVIAVIAGSVLALNSNLIFGNELTDAELSKAKILLFILVVNLAISFPNIVFVSHISANEKFIFQKTMQVIKTVTNPFIVLPVLLLGYGSVGMVLMTTLLNLIIEIGHAVYCIKVLKMKFSFKNFDFHLMKEMTVFSSFIFINLIIDQINWNVDKFILGRFHGTVAVAIYGLASQLNTYYLSISTAISSVFIPRVHRIVTQADSDKLLTDLFIRIGRVQFIILSLIASTLVFFGKPFIKLWAGNDYSDSYAILLLLIIPVTIPLIQNIGIEIQRAKNMHQFRSWMYLAIAVVNLIITIPLANRYAGMGAALGTGMSLIIGNGILMNWYNHVKVGLDMIKFWKEIIAFVPALVAPSLVGYIIQISFDINQVLPLLLGGILFVTVFLVSMWFFGMNNYEKELLNKPLNKIIGVVKAKF